MPRIQINLIGTSARPSASWTMTTQWAVSSLPTPGAMATALASARAALVASADFLAGRASNYSFVSLRALGYVTPTAKASWTVDASGTAQAGGGGVLVPPLAVVVSEQTGAAGPSFRGRSYFPGCGAGTPAGDGTVSAGQQTSVRNAWIAIHSALVAALNPLGGTPVHVVFSPKTGNMTPINLIRTGNRVDTARGRFGDAPESYTSQAIPGVVQITQTPAAPNEVSPEALGLPADTDDAKLQDFLDAFKNAQVTPLEELGPFKAFADTVKTLLTVKGSA